MHYRDYVNRDLNNRRHRPANKKRIPTLHWLLLAGAVGLTGTGLVLAPYSAEALPFLFKEEPAIGGSGTNLTIPLALPKHGEHQAAALAMMPATAAPASSAQAQDSSKPAEPWTQVEVRKGDTLGEIFTREGASLADLHRILSLGGAADDLKRIYPGQTIELKLGDDGQVLGVRYPLDKLRTLLVDGEPGHYQATIDELDVEQQRNFVSGTIENSLYLTAKKAGMSDKLIMELAAIFGWDVDFALDIRNGDHFAVIYEEIYADGEKIDDGEILAAEFVNQGQVFRAIRYVDPNGHSDYYTPDGLSMRKAFLRAPVDFRRISSGFTQERWHPVLGIKRPHRGVDYAAAIGTPVQAAGDGKVIWAGTKNGYGKTIIIQHGQQISTLYGHLNGYHKGIKNGASVKQGQIIGYVGMTGLATGPHLHYEFRVDGAHRNPLTVKLPKAEPIPAKYKADFQAHSQTLLSELELRSGKMVADATATH